MPELTDPDLFQTLLAKETDVWEALVSGDSSKDAEALTEDFLGVYPDGFAGKSDHVGQLSDGATVATYELSEQRLLPLGGDHALLAYKAVYTRTSSPDRPNPDPETMYVSSIWMRVKDGWQNVFSQDTPEGAGVV